MPKPSEINLEGIKNWWRAAGPETRGAIIGSLVGTGAGGLAGAVAGDEENRLRSALSMAALGGLGGGGLGYVHGMLSRPPERDLGTETTPDVRDLLKLNVGSDPSAKGKRRDAWTIPAYTLGHNLPSTLAAGLGAGLGVPATFQAVKALGGPGLSLPGYLPPLIGGTTNLAIQMHRMADEQNRKLGMK